MLASNQVTAFRAVPGVSHKFVNTVSNTNNNSNSTSKSTRKARKEREEKHSTNAHLSGTLATFIGRPGDQNLLRVPEKFVDEDMAKIISGMNPIFLRGTQSVLSPFAGG
jgi:hypothetical protein